MSFNSFFLNSFGSPIQESSSRASKRLTSDLQIEHCASKTIVRLPFPILLAIRSRIESGTGKTPFLHLKQGNSLSLKTYLYCCVFRKRNAFRLLPWIRYGLVFLITGSPCLTQSLTVEQQTPRSSQTSSGV